MRTIRYEWRRWLDGHLPRFNRNLVVVLPELARKWGDTSSEYRAHRDPSECKPFGVIVLNQSKVAENPVLAAVVDTNPIQLEHGVEPSPRSESVRVWSMVLIISGDKLLIRRVPDS